MFCGFSCGIRCGGRRVGWRGRRRSPSPAKEKELIAVLRSDAPAAEKAIACKHLAVYGSSEAVPELAQLLTDEQLASWSRIALEAIPGPAADEALRKALDSLKGRLLVGTINSIGVRRDAMAVDPLDRASAGRGRRRRVGRGRGPGAHRKCRRDQIAASNRWPPRRSKSVRRSPRAGALCRALRWPKATRPKRRRSTTKSARPTFPSRECSRRLAERFSLAKQEGIPLLIEQLRSPDKGLFQLALSTARELPGREVDEALAAEVRARDAGTSGAGDPGHGRSQGDGRLVRRARGRRRRPKQCESRPSARSGRVGDASCLSPLLEIAIESDAELVQTAKAALADLPGEKVDKDIVARLAKAEGKMYLLLIELVGQRRIDAVDGPREGSRSFRRGGSRRRPDLAGSHGSAQRIFPC